MQEDFAFGECALVDEAKDSGGIEQCAALMGRTASDVVEASTIGLATFAVALGLRFNGMESDARLSWSVSVPYPRGSWSRSFAASARNAIEA